MRIKVLKIRENREFRDIFLELSEHKKLGSPRITVSESLAIWCRIRKRYQLSRNNAAINKVCSKGDKKENSMRTQRYSSKTI